jgi:hypothetical protein
MGWWSGSSGRVSASKHEALGSNSSTKKKKYLGVNLIKERTPKTVY